MDIDTEKTDYALGIRYTPYSAFELNVYVEFEIM